MCPENGVLPLLPVLATSKSAKVRPVPVTWKLNVQPDPGTPPVTTQSLPFEPPFSPVLKTKSNFPQPPKFLLEVPNVAPFTSPLVFPRVSPDGPLKEKLSKTYPLSRLLTVNVATVPVELISIVTAAHGAEALQTGPPGFAPSSRNVCTESAFARGANANSEARATEAIPQSSFLKSFTPDRISIPLMAHAAAIRRPM